MAKAHITDEELNFLQTVVVTALKYTPAVGGSWAAPAPTNVHAALDRLAALCKTLNGNTPVP